MGIQCACSRTGEYGRFNELDELVNLDENLDSHFEVGTTSSKRCLCHTQEERKLARYQGDWMRVHMPELASKERIRRRRCDTTNDIASQRALVHLAVDE